MKRGKIFITILSVVLWGLLVSMLTTNCKNKNSGGRAESAVNTGRVINVSSPPFEKFVVVTNEGTELYKNADTNSPTLSDGWRLIAQVTIATVFTSGRTSLQDTGSNNQV